MATMIKEKPRQKKKKERQRLSPSPLTTVESPPLTQRAADGIAQLATSIPSTQSTSTPHLHASSICNSEDSPESFNALGDNNDAVNIIDTEHTISSEATNSVTTENAINRLTKPATQSKEGIPSTSNVTDETVEQPVNDRVPEMGATAPDLTLIQNELFSQPPTLARGFAILRQREAQVKPRTCAKAGSPTTVRKEGIKNTILTRNNNELESTRTNTLSQSTLAKPKLWECERLSEPKEDANAFSWKNAQNIFGTSQLRIEQRCNKEYYESDRHLRDKRSRDFFILLTEYIEGMKVASRKRTEFFAIEGDCEKARANLWTIEKSMQVTKGRCADGKTLDLRYSYETAKFDRENVFRLKIKFKESFENLTTDLSVRLHNSFVTKFKVDEAIHSELNEQSLLHSALVVLLTTLNRYDRSVPELHANVSSWAYYVAYRLRRLQMTSDEKFSSVMLLINYLVRQTHSIRWALPLVQIEIECRDDCRKTLVALSTILDSSRVNVETEDTTSTCDKPSKEEDWTVVEREGQELSERDSTCTLSEADLLGLLNQLPIAATMEKLMLLRPNIGTGELQFEGSEEQTGPEDLAVVKVICGALDLMASLKRGTLAYRAYRDVSHWLCRLIYLTLHCVADVHHNTRLQSRVNGKTLRTGLDATFRTGWTALQETEHSEIALTYMARMPFQMISDALAGELCDNTKAKCKLEETVECYHTMQCLQYIAESRPSGLLTNEVADYLYKIGFTRSSAAAEPGAWARSLLAQLMQRHPELYSTVLQNLAKVELGNASSQRSDSSDKCAVINEEWLRGLELYRWIPTLEQIHAVLSAWPTVDGLRIIITNLHSSVCKEVQHDLALRTVRHARQGGPAQEWMYRALTDLKLHAIDWQEPVDYVPSLSDSAVPDFQVSKDNILTAMWVLLTTSVGHSVPVICEQGAALLTHMASVGRTREAVHCLSFVMVVMVQSPESIRYTDDFKTLLTKILTTGQSSISALAGRLLGRQTESGAALLELVMRTHLLNTYKRLYYPSPRPLLQCWLELLTSPEDWATTPAILSLLDTAVQCCQLSSEATGAVMEHLTELLKKRPSTSNRSWLSGSTFSGLVSIAGTLTPALWLRTLQAEQEHSERASGIWWKLLWALHGQKSVNVDKALEESGGPQSAEGLVIYRTCAAILATPVAHFMHIHLLQYFFTLYLDRPIDVNPSEFAPVGVLFFRGMFKSRLLAQLIKRTRDTLLHHQERLKLSQLELDQQADCSRGGEEISSGGRIDHISADRVSEAAGAQKRVEHRLAVVKELQKYVNILEEKSTTSDLIPLPMLDMASQMNFTPGPGMADRSRQELPRAAPTLNKPWHLDVQNTLIELSTVERMVRRLKDYPPPAAIVEPALDLTPLLRAKTHTNILHSVASCIKEMAAYARDFDSECKKIKTIDVEIWKLIPQMYVPRPFEKTARRVCGAQCTGSAMITVSGEEWCRNERVGRDMEDLRGRRSAQLSNLMAPNEPLARLCAKLTLLVSQAERIGMPVQVFDLIMHHMGGRLRECAPVSCTVTGLALELGEKYVSMDVERLSLLLQLGSRASDLTRAVMKPSELPLRDLPVLYKAVLDQADAEPHVIFSQLSKFEISKWTRDAVDMYPEHQTFMEQILKGLVKIGANPRPEQMMLVELMAKHIKELVNAPSLRVLVVHVTQAATINSISPAIWPHITAAVETYAPLIDNSDECEMHINDMCTRWVQARACSYPVCALGDRAAHALPAAALARAYFEAGLATVVKYSAPPRQCAIKAFNPVKTWWNTWLQAHEGPENNEYPLLLPWASTDEKIPAKLLACFISDVNFLLDNYPDGGPYFLQEVMKWTEKATCLAVKYPKDVVRRHACAIFRTVEQLPWDRFAWLSVQSLAIVAAMYRQNADSLSLVTTALKGQVNWLPEEPHSWQYPDYMADLVLLLGNLPTETVDRAVHNLGTKFEYVDATRFGWLMDSFFNENNALESTSAPGFQVILAAATLTKTFTYVTPLHTHWEQSQAKRLALLGRWVSELGRALSERPTPEGRSAIATTALAILKAIQETCVAGKNGEGAGEEECVETCRVLLQTAALMFLNQSLVPAVLPAWLAWTSSAPSLVARAGLGVMAGVTSHEAFYKLSDAFIHRHLTLEGTWKEVLGSWSNSCGMTMEVQLRTQYFYTAYVTMQLLIGSGQAEGVQCANIIIRDLQGVKITESSMELPILIFLYFLFFTLPTPKPQNKPPTKDKQCMKKTKDKNDKMKTSSSSESASVASDTVSIGSGTEEAAEVAESDSWNGVQKLLSSWTESGRSRLKKLFSTVYEPSQSFQVMCKFSSCVAMAIRERSGDAAPAELDLYNKTYEELGNISRDKVRSSMGHAAATCCGWLRERSSLPDARCRHFHQLYCTLYPECATFLGEPPD